MAYRNYSDNAGHIVDATGHGDFTTIQAAINAAATAGLSTVTIYVKGGTYTENLSLVAGYNIVGDDSTNTIILGKASFSGAGGVLFSGVCLQTNSDYCISVTGASASTVTFVNCKLIASNHTAIQFTSSNSSSVIALEWCELDIQTTGITAWSSTSLGAIALFGCLTGNTGLSMTASNNSSGAVIIFHSNISFAMSTSGTGSLSANNSVLSTNAISTTAVAYSGTGGGGISLSEIQSDAATAISIGAGDSVIIYTSGISSSNLNAISGTGTLNAKNIVFFGVSSTIEGTLTVHVLPVGP